LRGVELEPTRGYRRVRRDDRVDLWVDDDRRAGARPDVHAVDPDRPIGDVGAALPERPRELELRRVELELLRDAVDNPALGRRNVVERLERLEAALGIDDPRVDPRGRPARCARIR